jgi:four helix bundle protein
LWEAPGPNYDEGCAAESRADFAHKLSIVLKELKETRGWLKFCIIAELLTDKRIAPLLDEAEQLIRIVASSVITAKGKSRRAFDVK